MDAPLSPAKLAVSGPEWQQIVQVLKAPLKEPPGVGVLGGVGIASFLFLYARAFPDPSGEEAANLVVGQMIDAPFADIAWGYAHGAAGMGSGLLWLRAQGLLELENLDFFEHLDKGLASSIPHFTSAEAELMEGLVGLGRYFVLRLSCTPDSSCTHTAKQALQSLLQGLGQPYLNVGTLSDTLDLLCDVHPLDVSSRTEELIHLYREQLLRVVSDCLRFRAYPRQFSLLAVQAVLHRAQSLIGPVADDCCTPGTEALDHPGTPEDLCNPATIGAPGTSETLYEKYSGPNDDLFAHYLARQYTSRPGLAVSASGPEPAYACLPAAPRKPASLALQGLKRLYTNNLAGAGLLQLFPLSLWGHEA